MIIITTMIPAKAFMYGRNMNLLKTSSSMEETVVVIWNTIASTHLWRSSSSCCWIWWLWWWRMTLTGFQWSGQDGAQTHWTNPGGDSKHWRPVDNNDGHDDDDCDEMMVKRSTWSAPHSWAVFFGLRCHITLQQWGNIMIMMVLMLHIWRLLLVHGPYKSPTVLTVVGNMSSENFDKILNEILFGYYLSPHGYFGYFPHDGTGKASRFLPIQH